MIFQRGMYSELGNLRRGIKARSFYSSVCAMYNNNWRLSMIHAPLPNSPIGAHPFPKHQIVFYSPALPNF